MVPVFPLSREERSVSRNLLGSSGSTVRSPTTEVRLSQGIHTETTPRRLSTSQTNITKESGPFRKEEKSGVRRVNLLPY